MGHISIHTEKHRNPQKRSDLSGELLLPSSLHVDDLKIRIAELQNDITSLNEFNSSNSANYTEQISILEQRNRDLQALVDNLQKTNNQAEDEKKRLEKDYIQQINKLSADVGDLTERLKQQYQSFLPDSCIKDIEERRFDTAEKKLREIDADRHITYVVDRVYKNNAAGRFQLLLEFGNKLRSIPLTLLVCTRLDQEMRISNSPDVFEVIDLTAAVQREIIDQANAPLEVSNKANDLLNSLKDRVKNMAVEVLSDAVKKLVQNSDNTNAIAVSNRIYLFDSSLYLNTIRGIFGKLNPEEVLKLIKINVYIAQDMAVCIAVFEKLRSDGHLNSSLSLKLAVNIRRTIDQPKYQNVISEMKSIFERLRSELPTSISALAFSSKVCIKSKLFGEYLYAATGGFNYDSDRRSVFTWGPGNKVSNGFWEIHLEGDEFSFKNTEFNEYLFASAFTFGNLHCHVDLDYRVIRVSISSVKLCTHERYYVFTWTKGGQVNNGFWEILHDDSHEGFYKIRNVKHNNYLFSSDSKHIDSRRRVLTSDGIAGTRNLWMFEDCSGYRRRRDLIETEEIGENIPHLRSSFSRQKETTNNLPYENTNSSYVRPLFANKVFDWFNKGASDVKSLAGGAGNSTDFGSESRSVADASGTMLLLDTIVRKLSGQRHTYSNVTMLPEQEASAHAIGIVEGFEAILEQAARNNRMPIIAFDIDFPKAQAEVVKKISCGRYDEISGILNAYAEDICPDQDIPDKMRPNTCYSFRKEVTEQLDALLNESISKMMVSRSTVFKF